MIRKKLLTGPYPSQVGSAYHVFIPYFHAVRNAFVGSIAANIRQAWENSEKQVGDRILLGTSAWEKCKM